MTITPTPPNDPQSGNQTPPRRVPAFELTKVNIVLASLALLGVLLCVWTIAKQLQQPAPPPSVVAKDEEKMAELGRQWAEGYVAALKVNNPDQNVINSLYGACVVYTDRSIIPQYGQQLAPSWLNGCLDYTRTAQQSSETAASTTTK